MQESDLTKYITIITVCVTFPVFIILLCLPQDIYNVLVDDLFQGFVKITSVDDQSISKVSYWTHLEKTLKKRLSTLPVFFLLIVILMLVFIDGCILKAEYIYPYDICPSTQSHCFVRYMNKSKGMYPCTENEIAISNITNIQSIVCYTWIVRQQTSIDIFNQLGLCTGILALLGLYFKLLYWMTRSKCLMVIIFVVSIGVCGVVLGSIFDDIKIDLHLSIVDKWLIALIAVIHAFIWVWTLSGNLQENKTHNDGNPS